MSDKQQTVRRHYWLREDFDELIGVIPGADMALGNDRDASASLVYPKSLKGAVAELKLRGIDCDAATLQDLVANGVVKPKRGTSMSFDKDGKTPVFNESESIQFWSKEDIDRAAEHLYDEGRWGHWTHFCWVSNLRFGQAVKAHRVACIRHNLGFHVSFDVLGLVTVIDPSPNCEDYARIRFFPMGTRLEAATQEVSE